MLTNAIRTNKYVTAFHTWADKDTIAKSVWSVSEIHQPGLSQYRLMSVHRVESQTIIDNATCELIGQIRTHFSKSDTGNIPTKPGCRNGFSAFDVTPSETDLPAWCASQMSNQRIDPNALLYWNVSDAVWMHRSSRLLTLRNSAWAERWIRTLWCFQSDRER